MATRRVSHDSLSLASLSLSRPLRLGWSFLFDCPICPPVGKHDGISARVSTQCQYDCPTILCFSSGSLGVASGILRASLLCSCAGAPIAD